jgi:hypothetical protein
MEFFKKDGDMIGQKKKPKKTSLEHIPQLFQVECYMPWLRKKSSDQGNCSRSIEFLETRI